MEKCIRGQRILVRERHAKDILVPVPEVLKGDRVLENEDDVGRK